MSLIEQTGIFILASVLVLAVWFIYLFLNEMLDKLPNGFVQEILGIAMSFGLIMAIGVILYHYSYSFFMGWFLVVIALMFYRGIHKVFCRFSRPQPKAKAALSD